MDRWPVRKPSLSLTQSGSERDSAPRLRHPQAKPLRAGCSAWKPRLEPARSLLSMLATASTLSRTNKTRTLPLCKPRSTVPPKRKIILFGEEREDLDGVGEGEGDNIAGFDACEEKARGGAFDEVVEARVGEIEIAGDGDCSAGGEYSGDMMEQSGECGWGLHCFVFVVIGMHTMIERECDIYKGCESKGCLFTRFVNVAFCDMWRANIVHNTLQAQHRDFSVLAKLIKVNQFILTTL
ncbi:hypothetical protein CR513_50942, partial [Mucuna pruriens]